VLGAVSPPGGDLAEPVTAHTRRFVRSVWSLDRDLAYSRHYPAIGWRDSYSRDAAILTSVRAEAGDRAWGERRDRALRLLAHADELESIAQLVGTDSLPASERAALRAARVLREGVLQQSAIDPNDQYSTPAKQQALLALALDVSDRLAALVERDVAIDRIDLSAAIRARSATAPGDVEGLAAVAARILADLDGAAP
jgi:V/A-type H+/Na+-transporting ATPase subunit A